MSQDQNRRQFWETHYGRCQQLGMTLKAFAEKEGLTVSVFYGWRKRFKREHASVPKISRVKVTPSEVAEYRLRFPNGLVLEWNGEADVQQLARLVNSPT